MLPYGGQYLDGDSALSFYEIFESSFEESTATTPIFFILSPGADPVKEIEALGKKMGYTANFNLHNVALGQARYTAKQIHNPINTSQGIYASVPDRHFLL